MSYSSQFLRAAAVRLPAMLCLIGNFWGSGGDATCACNVPVFRYALERWYPDPYRLTLLHRGPLTDAEQAQFNAWDRRKDELGINVTFRDVDVDRPPEESDRALWESSSNAQLPRLTLQYPISSRIESIVWAGSFTEESWSRLTDSPARKELIQRLTAGQTAVWLMLECGDAAKDAAAAAQLERELTQLANRLELPELTAAPEDNLLSDAPLKVAFSLLRVPRNAAAEQPLAELLLHAEPDLAEFAEPMVFPVFGRGRALLPLIGAGITADNIHHSAEFLVGACSCEIKELNPGFDLLLAADWNALLFKDGRPREIAESSRAAASGEPTLVAIPAGAPRSEPTTASTSDAAESRDASSGLSSLPGLALIGLLLAALTAVAFKRFA